MSARRKPSTQTPPAGLTPLEAFHWVNGGWSHAHGETAAEGRVRCAKEAAEAATWALAHGYRFQWSIDRDIDSSFFGSKRNPYSLWQCVMVDDDGELVQALGGIDFGRDGEPWGQPYMRVVEAELASEQQHESNKGETT